jgi:hypothetical protein
VKPGFGVFQTGRRFLFLKASFVSTGSIPIGMDKYNKKIVIVTIRDPDLFRVENEFSHDRYTKRLGINPLVKRCGTNPALRSLVLPIMIGKLIFDPE